MFKKVRIFLEMIKIEHTLFALPFAFMGAILGAMVMDNRFPTLAEWGWILMAMVGARSAAMALNRLIDAAIDAKNPRTANRAIPAGLLKAGEVILFTAVSFGLLFWAAANLQPLAVYLLPIAVFMLVIYSFTKRFTWLCHFILGLTIALAPLGGWVAVTNEINWTSIIFYLTVACWTTGFDVIYACQDYEFDRKEGLKSIPVRFGIAKALWIARGFHIVTAIGFLLLLFVTQLSWWYIIGTVIASGLLIYEHMLVKPYDLSRTNTAFFTLNGILSIVVFAFTLLDLVVLGP
ncbi:putative 4-hydroxybenzoate polyprenyltransferase [Paenibacillus thiaminolyticus]|uniref:4-hydroxybenzoate polyprenyltransferase n=1 Tax=Paenibacillus thiaminolyticus TaxID=49283 RepID=A0AAJ1G9Y0_PANTH|nr:UbiA-like polyprenyltransferase [Paenibacillus thiaminolyticus]MCY9537882.1 putative 4-hydroxybenzoate polyprenyltransferase [Paenibacillus thiaminolyticus]MCY9602638.1 putative 4-hydroxybenzoate polyprenyltransferase [Paenibacillus thiaminolyticus]MCY9611071.1 putative 4-hydroxybenzoate polyprenyltransferase [Paenibacillus thiaminolyticus]MCY9616735.1 putative 4-hydroxybenzoate polyprenyltransferase [Paenibacillus thiaminolyticus]MCY9619435.1 putative 4-hydroxybenzoate polyprenyltransferas